MKAIGVDRLRHYREDRTKPGPVPRWRARRLALPSGVVMRTFTEADARAYVDHVEWRFATTMAHIPHWYTIVKWDGALTAQFHAFVALIASEGVRVPWPKPPRKARYRKIYLFLDGWKYWYMDDDPKDVTLVNRAHIDSADESYRGPSRADVAVENHVIKSQVPVAFELPRVTALLDCSAVRRIP